MSSISWVLAVISIVGLVGIFAHRIVTRKGFGARVYGLVSLVVMFPIVSILVVEDFVSPNLLAILAGLMGASGATKLFSGLGSDE